MGKITQKEMSKLFSCDYDHYEQYVEMSPLYMNFEEVDTECSTGKT